jgi:hypothetical protein
MIEALRSRKKDRERELRTRFKPTGHRGGELLLNVLEFVLGP